MLVADKHKSGGSGAAVYWIWSSFLISRLMGDMRGKWERIGKDEQPWELIPASESPSVASTVGIRVQSEPEYAWFISRIGQIFRGYSLLV